MKIRWKMDEFTLSRLLPIAALSAVFSLATSGLEVLYSVSAIQTWDIDSTAWTQVRSWRFLLTVPVVFALGIGAIRLGQRMIATWSVFLSVAAMLAIAVFPSSTMFLFTFCLFGSLVSVIMISLNVTVQEVGEAWRAKTNTLYRSVFIICALLGPLCTSLLLRYGISTAFLFYAFCYLFAIYFIRICMSEASGTENETKLKHSDTFREYLTIMRDTKHLLVQILAGIGGGAFYVSITLGPFKLIQEFGMSGFRFSQLMVIHPLLSFLLTLAIGPLLNKRTDQLLAGSFLLISLGNMAMGMAGGLLWGVLFFVISNACFALTTVPYSLWIAKRVPPSLLSSAFSLSKLLQMLLGFMLTAAMTIMEPLLGINGSFLLWGIVGLFAGVGMIALGRVNWQGSRVD